jgi:vanillate O-demethylase ferredoxin subunit
MDSKITVCVARKSVEAQDICAFELVAVEGESLPSFTAGSHIDVHLPGGIIRQYSLCNDPSETHRYVIGVLKDPASRGGSLAMHESVSEGDRLTISAPRNHFPLVEAANHSLLLAGGIGITPILCMAQKLASQGASFSLHYGVRSRQRAAFLREIQSAGLDVHARLYVDDDPQSQRLNVGALLAKVAPTSHLYVCGPQGFIDAVLDAARSANWPSSQIHYEFFGVKQMHPDSDVSFDVRIASSGQVVRVEQNQTVVQALELAGVSILTSCEQGFCGTCLTGILEGNPDHRDLFLTPQEQAANDRFLPCCSRSRSQCLVLDL